MPTTPTIKPGAKTAAGLLTTRSGKLQLPYKFTCASQSPGHNCYGQPYPNPGDFVASALPSGTLSAGTVGVIAALGAGGCHDGSFVIHFLDGRREESWRYGCATLTEEQVREVQDYYNITERRPERIKNQLVP